MMLTKEILNNELNYDKKTGVFKWKTSKKGRKSNPGYIEKSTGYYRICINKKKYYAHRLAWFFVHGEMPILFIDHIDGNKLNNSIENLRQANFFQNAQNVKLTKRNKSGFKGVSFYKRDNTWAAQCKHLGITYYLGRYKTAIEAKEVYDNFVIKNCKKYTNKESLLYPDISLKFAKEALEIKE